MKNKFALKRQYLEYSIGYYIAGRFSVFGNLWVVGNLLHHALEMLLKGFLCEKHDEFTLRNFSKRGHSILDAWNLFKKEIKDVGADQFDDIIAALDDFEDIRYPDKVVNQGAIIIIDSLSTSSQEFKRRPNASHYNSLNSREEKIYHFNLSSVDLLVEFIFSKIDINPNSLINLYSKDEMEYLKKNNMSKIWEKRKIWRKK